MRWVFSARRWSWVTMTTVVWSSRLRVLSDLHDLVAHLGVEVARGLVGQEQLGTPHDRARDRDPLLLPAGELRGEVVHAGGEAHALEGGEGQPPALGAGEAPVDERQLHVVEHAQVVDQVEGLEDEADLLVAQAGEVLVLVGHDGRAVELDRALARRVEEAEHVQQRALARPRGPHDRDEARRLHLEVDVRERHRLQPVGAVDLLDVRQSDHGRSPT